MFKRLISGEVSMAAVVLAACLALAATAQSQCFPDATDVSGQLGISNVQLGTLQNNTGGATTAYTDYTSLTPPLVPIASTRNLQVTASSGFTIAVWFDWNQNNVFEASEKLNEVVSSDSVTSTVIPFTVPGGSLTGNTRMRIRAIQAVTGVDPCTSAPALADRGETEDYFINVSPAIQVTTASLAIAEVGLTYSQTLAATGGVGTLTWALTSGTLPSGISFIPAGALAGVPLAGSNNAQPYVLTFSVSDQANPVNVTAVTFNLTVQAFTGLPVSIVTTSLPNGIVGQPYNSAIFAVNGANPTGSTTPYNFSITALNGGSLPPGLGLSASGLVAGNPITVGVFSFQIEVRDPANFVATQNYSITVSAPTGGGGGSGGGGGGGSVTLEGGGGCALGSGYMRGHWGMLTMLLALLGVVAIARRRA